MAIWFDDVDAATLTIEQWCEIRTKSISHLPQDMGLFPELTVAQNIDLKNNKTNHKTQKQIKELLDRLGIVEKYDVPGVFPSSF